MISEKKALESIALIDPLLSPFLPQIANRIKIYNRELGKLCKKSKLSDFANGYLYFGFHREENGWVFREWLPGADAVYLYGDFNSWNKSSHPLYRVGDNGVWEIRLEGKNALCHGQFIKLMVEKDNDSFERIPAYIRRAVMDENTWQLCGQIWAPDEEFIWTDRDFHGKRSNTNPLIYEAHIGMAQEKQGVGTFREFADNTLEWISQAGYNTIQLMAIAEHPYYASFGYQVTNFFAPSSRFGTPEDLKYLINKAHGMGIFVLLDIVHSHACPNVAEGLNFQDGTEGCYFYENEAGYHPAWGTRCFDYGRSEVLHFLLSNLKYWQEEFHFDGFRFDGVTSMLYKNHGLGVAFTNYGQYYTENTDMNSAIYLMLANSLVHSINKRAITVAEDMSGMPGLCLPHSKGGFGFDYRLSMGVPDLWIKLIKEQRPEDWNMFYLQYELTTSRKGEKSIGYCESHDQAMVGDKTIMFRLADAHMYTSMGKDCHDLVIDYAMDMHKLIRLLTFSLSKNGYLNFMGNEFGHPEWIDFPREGNGWSYHYARRQWSLVQDEACKYKYLAAFDRAMTALCGGKLHSRGEAEFVSVNDDSKLMVFCRNGSVFAFNLHPQNSCERLFIDCRHTGKGDYRVVLSSDDEAFAGQGRISKEYIYTAKTDCRGTGFEIYIPARCAVVIEKTKGNG